MRDLASHGYFNCSDLRTRNKICLPAYRPNPIFLFDSHSDISSCTILPSTFESRRYTISSSECFSLPSSPSTPVLPEHPTIAYHVKKTMADSRPNSEDKGSPSLRPFHPKTKPSPSPPPDESLPKRVPPTANNREDDRPGGTWATAGDAVLIGYLGDKKNPDIARSAVEEGLPSDKGDEDPMKNVPIPGSQAPENPMLKRLRETAFGALEQDNSLTPPPAKRGVAYRLDNETRDSHPNERSLTNGLPLLIYDDTSPPEEAS